jgi:hypothetical protein
MVKLLLILAIFFSPVFLFLNFLKKKKSTQKASSWKGKLVDKEHLEYEDDDSPYTKDLYTLHFKTDEEKTVKINVPKNVFEFFNIDDRVEKKVGVMYPEKK